jgi:hypothetical protein
MAFVAVYDACVLYPNSLRDLLIRIAVKGLLQARWTDQILDECFRNIIKQRPELDPRKLERTRTLMNEAVPDCLVRGYEALIDSLTLPDPDDRHVLAAAIVCGAQMIVTFNLKDFPASALEPFNIEAQHPDDFIVNQIYLQPGAVIGTINQQAAALRDPPYTANDVIDSLERAGLIQSATMLRALLPR